MFRDPQDGEYASKSTLLGGTTINPLAFPDAITSIDSIVSV